MSDTQDKTRRRSTISVEVSPETRDVLDKLMVKINADSIHEVVRRALYHYNRDINKNIEDLL